MPNQESQVKLQTMRIGAFPGGMNTSVLDNEIDDGEAVRIRNMEYDDGDNLTTRNGVIGANGVVGVWDETDWDASLWDADGTVYSSPILSQLDFESDTGFVGILYTVGTDLLSRTLAGVITDLTGALALPDGVRWYWRIFNGVAIGVNGLTSGHNPIQVVGPAPGTASHLSTAPPAKFIEVWKNRLWIARSDEKSQIQCSDIGSHSSWNTDAGANPAHGAKWEIDKKDGDEITALYSTKERFFVFKRNSIHVGEEDPNHPNDVRFVKFKKFNKNIGIGCIAASSIQAVLDDVFFLSRYGVAALSAAEIVADFESASVSLKVADIQDIRQDLTDEDVCSGLVTDRSQYWLCVSRSVSATSENITYVFDYRQLKKGIARWVEFDGLAFGTSMEVYDHDEEKLIYLLGCHDTENNEYFIGQYIPKARDKTFIDSSSAIRYFIQTKAYDFDLPDIRKFLSEWYSRVKSLTENVSLSYQYFLDESSQATDGDTLNLGAEQSGAVFDDPTVLFDNGELFDQGSDTRIDLIRRSFKHGKLRKARTVQFTIFDNQINQGFAILAFGIKYQPLSEYRAQTV